MNAKKQKKLDNMHRRLGALVNEQATICVEIQDLLGQIKDLRAGNDDAKRDEVYVAGASAGLLS